MQNRNNIDLGDELGAVDISNIKLPFHLKYGIYAALFVHSICEKMDHFIFKKIAAVQTKQLAKVECGECRCQVCTPDCLRFKDSEQSTILQAEPYTAHAPGKIENPSGKIENANHPFFKMLLRQNGLSECLDKTIVCVIEHNSKLYFGINGIKHTPADCPRNKAKLGINTGYDVCNITCGQKYHAEEMAIEKWLADWEMEITDPLTSTIINPHKARAYVYGAKQVCERCQALCDKYDLPVIKVTTNLDEVFEHGK